jgi:hypothetical protein
VVDAEPASLIEGDLDHHLDPRRRNDLLDDDPLVAAEHRGDGLPDRLDVDAELPQHVARRSLRQAQQAEKKVLGSDVRVV